VRWGPNWGTPGQPSTQYDIITPSIAVNANSDYIIGFQTVSPSDYLQAQYAYHSHDSASISLTYPFTFKYGSGYYANSVGGGSYRPGDYGHANPDPVDDNSFFVAAGYAGSNWSGTSYYGWSHGWALVKPPPAMFISSVTTDSDNFSLCTGGNGNPLTCPVTVGVPAGAQAGDTLVGILAGEGATTPPPTLPSGWSIISVANNGNAQYVQTGGYTACPNCYIRQWATAHKYATGDPGSYTFTVTENPLGYDFGWVYGEPDVFVADYRGVSGSIGSFSAYGYPSTNLPSGGTLSIGPINPANNLELVGLFWGSDDSDDYTGGISTTFTGPWGYPPLSVETPRTLGTSTGVPVLASDLWTSGFTGFNYGSYSTTITNSLDLSGNAVGWLLTMPSQ